MLFVKAGTFCLCPFLARVVFSLYSLTLWAPLYEEGRWPALPQLLSFLLRQTHLGISTGVSLVWGCRYTSSRQQHPAQPEMVTVGNSRCAGNRF